VAAVWVLLPGKRQRADTILATSSLMGFKKLTSGGRGPMEKKNLKCQKKEVNSAEAAIRKVTATRC